MRVGKGIHPDGVPGWCQGFSLDGGSGVRAVKVIQPGNRPGLIYNIGEWNILCFYIVFISFTICALCDLTVVIWFVLRN